MGALGASRRALATFLFSTALISGAAAAETAIKFSLDFRFEGPAAPFLVPLDKGYYKAEGVNVNIDTATGSAESIARVAGGVYDMGFADINALIKYRDAGAAMPPKAVFMVYNRPPYAVIGRKSRGIHTPKDLEGKTLGAPAADISFAQWPIFVKANGIDAGKVRIENLGFPVREPMLAAGQVDAVTGFSFATFVDLKDKGVPVDDIAVLLMADYGVDLYGSAIIVNPKFAAEHGDAVRGFLRAYLKGLKDTVKSPASGVEAVLRRNDGAKKPAELERLTIAIRDNIVTPDVKANGYGGIDPARFEKAVDQLGLTTKWKLAKPKLDDIFDASFLPGEAERKFK
jgi:NitT/TauT family transport system substrate-binding protein